MKLILVNLLNVLLVFSLNGIYIVIHKQTVSLYQNSSVWLDT